MLNRALMMASVVFFANSAFAAENMPLDCKMSKPTTPFSADITGKGMSRSVNVHYKSKPSTRDATSAVQACVKMAVAQDASVDAAGAAWLDNETVHLSGGTFYAYFSKTKTYGYIF